MKETFWFFLNQIKKDWDFWFIKNDKIREELYYSFSYCLYLPNLNKNDNLFFLINLQTSIIYLWSVVEALLYEYVFEYLRNKDPNKIKKYCKNIYYIEKHITDWILKDNLVVCEKKEKTSEFKEDINFQSLINWVKDYKLLSNDVIKHIDDIRQKRNIVHLKVLVNFKNSSDIYNDLLNLTDKYIYIFKEIEEKFKEL